MPKSSQLSAQKTVSRTPPVSSQNSTKKMNIQNFGNISSQYPPPQNLMQSGLLSSPPGYSDAPHTVMMSRETNREQDYNRNLPPRHNKEQSSRREYVHEKSNRDNSSFRTQVIQQAMPKTRLSINIEVLKNMSMRFPDASFLCRIDFKSKNAENDPIDLCSHLMPVENRTVRLGFRGELDIDLESFVSTFSKEHLKIYTFCKKGPATSRHQGSTDVFLYGQSEIDISMLLLNTKTFETTENNSRMKTLAGWYHIYDPEDPYRTMGQMKVI